MKVQANYRKTLTARALFSASLAALVLGTAAASAAPTAPLASVTSMGRISALSGWVVWSAAKPNGTFALDAWHDGATATLPVKASGSPFDVDLGTDEHGRVVAVFPRCTSHSIRHPDGSLAVAGGCTVRAVDLLSGAERSAGIPRSVGDSDTNASMWAGRIAVARHSRRHKDVEQLFLWSPATRKLTALPHGAVPTNCPFRHKSDCAGLPVSGTITDLDMNARLAAFVWQVEAPAVVGHGGSEVRAVTLKSRYSSLVGSGFSGEACTGGTDGSSPSSPTVVGSSVWYSQLSDDCYVFKSELNVYGTNPLAGSTGSLPGTVLHVAKDGPRLYALIAPPNPPNTGPTCSNPGAPCTIQQIDTPTLTLVPNANLPRSPFF